MSVRFFLIFLFLNFHLFSQEADQLFNEGKQLLEEGKKRRAVEKFENALEKYRALNNIEAEMDCHLELADLKNNVIEYKDALGHYKSFGALYREKVRLKTEVLEESVADLSSEVEESNSTIENQEKSLDSLTIIQINTKLELANLELEKQKNLSTIQAAQNRRNLFIAVICIGVLLLCFAFIGYSQKRKTNKSLVKLNNDIVIEKTKSEELLENILPKKIAAELKENGKTTSMKYDLASVMFTDFKGFTSFSEKKSPEELVAIIDYYFSGFDAILSEFKVEKIKTIGDAYLCVTGIPQKDDNQVENILNCAQKMLAFVQHTKINGNLEGNDFMDIRIGIHTGPIVAGVVGTKKFAYDIWGDTVNIAARMEQSGLPGKINVSETVFNHAPKHFNFEYRGEISAKNKGLLKMYLLA